MRGLFLLYIGGNMKLKDCKKEANEMYDRLIKIDAFLNGLEIGCGSDSLKESVYEIKQESFAVRGFLLKFI